MKKLLHLSFHQGARAEIRWVMAQLGIAVEDFDFDDGSGNERYNLTPERSEVLWSRVRDRVDDFDWILTSDTASLARPFLTHRKKFRGRLVVWINNRFDYWHGRKPDPFFYQQYRDAAAAPETLLVPYTEFESVYAAYHGVEVPRRALRPTGMGFGRVRVAKNDRYFLPPYANDVHFSAFMPKVIPGDLFEHRRYEGPSDIARFRAVIHIPYSWSNYALFEHWAQGMVYYVPSLHFYRKLWSSGGMFFPDANYMRHWRLAEWWRRENRERFIYFDSWAELKRRLFLTRKLKLPIEENLGRKILRLHASQTESTLRQWRDILHGPARVTQKKKSFFFPAKALTPKKSVAVVLAATNRYLECFPAFYDKAKLHFLPGVQKHFFVMTDRISDPVFSGKFDVTPVPVEHRPWPYPTLLRFRYIERIAEKLRGFTHLVAIDVDTAVVSPVGEKRFFGHKKPLFGVRHPGFVGKKGTFEDDPRSLAAVGKTDDLSVYWAGGLWGGETEPALAMAAELARRIEDDLSRGVIAVWHDESHLNKYFIENRKDVHIFDPGYMYPESLDLPYTKRILALNKDHAEIREQSKPAETPAVIRAENKIPQVPAVSVVMPVFNAAGHLAEALESISKQTFQNYEFIIVDDGSVDATPKILKRYASADPRVRVVTQENRGVVEALNLGCRMARGKYIARMDADDISLPERLQKQLEFLEQHPEVGAAGTWYSLIHKGGGDSQPPALEGSIRWTMCFHNCVCHPSAMMRRELLESLGFYRAVAHCEDYDLWLRALKVTSIRNIPECLFRYRISDRSVSKKFSQVQNESHLKLMRSRISDLLKREAPPEDVAVLRQADAFAGIENAERIESAAKLLDDLYAFFQRENLVPEDLQWITQSYHRRKYVMYSKASEKKRSIFLFARKVFYFWRYFHHTVIRPKFDFTHFFWTLRDLARKTDRKLFRGAVYRVLYRPAKTRIAGLLGAFTRRPSVQKDLLANLQRYRIFLENGTYEGQDWSLLPALPKSRYETLRQAFGIFSGIGGRTIVELGTTRSFCGGAYEGCNRDEVHFWEPENPARWDWGAGSFTRVAAEVFSGRGVTLHTVDAAASHIQRCRTVTEPFKKTVRYHVSTSEDFLKNFRGKIDLLYLDTGDMTPIEATAELHLREAKIIVERGLVGDSGVVLIDDIQNQTPRKFGETSALGKGKYSIPYFLENGFELLEPGYQYLLRKKKSPKKGTARFLGIFSRGDFN